MRISANSTRRTTSTDSTWGTFSIPRRWDERSLQTVQEEQSLLPAEKSTLSSRNSRGPVPEWTLVGPQQ